MSSILKALRKVEDEKATLGEGSVDLAHDILKHSYGERQSIPWALILLGGLLLIVVAGAGAGWFLSDFSQPQTSVSTAAPQAVVALPPAKVQPELPPATTAVEQEVEQSAARPLKPVQAQVSVPVAVKINENTLEGEAVVPFDLPNLRIDEIVYHADPVARLAIINDLPVMVGTDIEGARVEEILSDRVRFSLRGKDFYRLKKQQ